MSLAIASSRPAGRATSRTHFGTAKGIGATRVERTCQRSCFLCQARRVAAHKSGIMSQNKYIGEEFVYTSIYDTRLTQGPIAAKRTALTKLRGSRGTHKSNAAQSATARVSRVDLCVPR